MIGHVLYTVFILATGAERISELFTSKRHAAWAFEQGGVESGRGHFPAMVMLHTGLLVGCLAEVWLLDPLNPAPGQRWVVVGWVALALIGMLVQFQHKKRKG